MIVNNPEIYIEAVNGVTNTHHRFVYDGYLCIQRLNAAANNAIDLVFGWDPSEPVATRPLILQKYGQYNLFYTHDGNKNVSELVFFQQANGIAAHYEYAPFGAVTATTRSTPVTAYDFREYNPFRFSSEYFDGSLCLLYYNYRHYDSRDCRWFARDILCEEWGLNLYNYCENNTGQFDYLGATQHGSNNVGSTEFRHMTNEEVSQELEKLSSKGRLTSAEKQRLQKLKTEQKARGIRRSHMPRTGKIRKFRCSNIVVMLAIEIAEELACEAMESQYEIDDEEEENLPVAISANCVQADDCSWSCKCKQGYTAWGLGELSNRKFSERPLIMCLKDATFVPTTLVMALLKNNQQYDKDNQQ